MLQLDLFSHDPKPIQDETTEEKTYHALRHIRQRAKQDANDDAVHHPDQKIRQIHRAMGDFMKERKLTATSKPGVKICEFFAGRGNLTREFEQYGQVEAFDQKWLKTGDSFLVFHRLIAERKNYQVIDIDGYGFPSRMLPDVFLLMEDGLFFITMPKPSVNILTGITAQHLTCYFDQRNPSLDQVLKKLKNYALCHWRDAIPVEIIDLGRLWRIALRVRKVKATEYTGVRNH